MKKIGIIALLLWSLSSVQGQKNLVLEAQVTYDQNLSDIWGYTDAFGNEYALVCLRSGVAIEHITDPANPARVAIIPAPTSSWRDAKTFGHFAYLTNESNGGIQVIDLSNLPNAPDTSDVYFWTHEFPDSTSIQACHNLYIDEFGYGYLSGCNINNGEILIIDLFTNPGNPAFVTIMPIPNYSHDVYVRDNLLYSSDMFNGFFSVYDVSNKQNIQLLATQDSPFEFTHNTWLSDDGNTLFTTDETNNAPVGAYDVSDQTDIKLLDEFRPLASINTGLIPHNVHVINDYLVTSFYSEGVIITDAHRPQNLIEVGNFDTFFGENGGSEGVWGAYPFFPSGTVVLSDIGSGLYILTPNYVRACYLEGTVRDSVSGELLKDVQVSILSDDPNQELSNALGAYKTGQVSAGTFQVVFSKQGYISKTLKAVLENGEVTLLDAHLAPDNFSTGLAVSFNAMSTSGCVPFTTSFQPNITNGLEYQWKFIGPDTIQSSEMAPSITFEKAGDYTVQLMIRSAMGSGETVSESIIHVMGKPVVDFSLSLEGRTVKTNNLTSNGFTFFWKFGDGTTSEKESPTHTYMQDGMYTVELTAYNDCSGSTSSQTIMVMSTAIEEIEELKRFASFPNPFSQSMIVFYEFKNNLQSAHLLVFDLFGRAIEKVALDPLNETLNLGETWDSGIYFIQLQANGVLSTPLKVVKNK